MNIRKAILSDFNALYKIGLETPEFKVNDQDVFMEAQEFLSAIDDPSSIILLAESEADILGFVYFSEDSKKNQKDKSAYLAYIVVKHEHRGEGVAQKLLDSAISELKKGGVTNLKSWVSTKSDGSILKFLKRNGFRKGYEFVWMDKEI